MVFVGYLKGEWSYAENFSENHAGGKCDGPKTEGFRAALPDLMGEKSNEIHGREWLRLLENREIDCHPDEVGHYEDERDARYIRC